VKLLGISFRADGGLYCSPLATNAADADVPPRRCLFRTRRHRAGGPTANPGDACILDLHQTSSRMTGSGSSAIYASGELMGIGGATRIAARRSRSTAARSRRRARDRPLQLLELHMENTVAFRHDPGVLVGRLRRQRGPARSTSDVRQLSGRRATAPSVRLDQQRVYDTLHNNHEHARGTIAETTTIRVSAGRQSERHEQQDRVSRDPDRSGRPRLPPVDGSPAIDAADPSATMGVDYDGTARPQGHA